MRGERWLYIVPLRLRSLLRRRQVERELDEELRFHLERAIEQRLAQGASPSEARRAALLAMGGIERRKEESREARGVGGVEHLVRDVRYAFRLLRRNPGFTAVAVLTLALGMGANTTLFSLIDAVLLRTLPVREPSRLFFLDAVGTAGPNGAPPYPYFERLRDGTRSFAGLAAFGAGGGQKLVIDGRVEQAFAQYASGSYFEVLGVRPVLGRVLTAEDERLAPPVAVIGHGYWQRRFGGDPSVVGRAVKLGSHVVTIVGVTGPSFTGLEPGLPVDITLPITLQGPEVLADRDQWWLELVGRLAPGATAAAAQAEADALFQRFMAEGDTPAEAIRAYFDHIELSPASRGLDGLRRRFTRPLLMLMVVVGLVLSIACANVANLLLARSAARGREIAVRLAIGAGPDRVRRQLLTETLLLFACGAGAGLLFAYGAGRFITGFFAVGRTPLRIDLAFDARVLAFTAGLTLLTVLIFGMAPALRAAAADLHGTLKEGGGKATMSRRRVHGGQLLVVSQVAFSLVLLMAAGLFARTLANLGNVDGGFRAEGVLTLSVEPLPEAYEGDRLGELWRELLPAVRAIPGVRSAGLSVLTPLSGRDRGVGMSVPGFEPPSGRPQMIHLNHVSDGFLETLGMTVAAGRAFDARDRAGAPNVTILNEAAARYYFGDGNPIGAGVQLGAGPSEAVYRVVGIVRDAKHRSLREPAPRFVYLPVFQPRDHLGRLTLVVRSDGDPASLLPAVRQRIAAVGQDILIAEVMTMRQQVRASLLRERLVSTLCGFFGLLALLLSAVGLYGVVAHAVALRTREIGIRTALGARPRGVTWMVLRENLALVLLGVAIGVPLALLAARPAARMLYGLSPADPSTAAASTAVLLAVAALAAWIPARRAARVDPVVALRRE